MKLLSVILKSYISSLALFCPAPERDYECFFVILEVYLTTLFWKIFCFLGWDGTDTQTDRHMTDRFFPENIILHYFRQTILGGILFGVDVDVHFLPNVFYTTVSKQIKRHS